MENDEQGFLYPSVKDKCIKCGKCVRVCPIINKRKQIKFEQNAFLLQHRDERILRESTSGGAFTAIASQIILDEGVVFGACYESDFSVSHKYVESLDELTIFRNSKYVQSKIGSSYLEVKNFLKEGRKVCFSGTPCQIEGLLNFLGKKSSNLILVDIVCHAVPSPLVWATYLKILDNRGVRGIKNLRFRDKEKYGYLYSQFAIQTKEGSLYQGIESNEMLKAFFSEICNRPSCYDCQFKTQFRRSDITIWDCFDVKDFTRSSLFNQSKGVSRVLVHTANGAELLSKLENDCLLEKISVDNALHCDAHEMFYSVKKNRKYNDFWRDFSIDPQKTLLSFFSNNSISKFECFARKIIFRCGLYPQFRKIYKMFFGNRKR